MKYCSFGICLEKILTMLPISTVLFTLSCFTPSMVNSFARFRHFSSINVAARLNVKKHRPRSMVRSGSVNSVIVGAAALEKLTRDASYVRSPMIERNEFLQWAKQMTGRKSKTDKEFGEKVKVRELKKLHSETIKRLEDDVNVSREKYLLNSNSVLIIELDRVICNCLQATRNMEYFLSKSPVVLDDISTSEVIPAKDTVGEDTTAESRLNIDPALSATADYLVINELLIDGEDAMGAEAGDVCDDVRGKESAMDMEANKRLHVSRIYPLKKTELLKKQLEREELLKSTPEYYEYTKCQEELVKFLEEVGLQKAEKSARIVEKGAGIGRNTRGQTFEDTADSVITDHLLPRLAMAHNCKTEDMMVIRNLKFGMGGTKGSTSELDSVICIRTEKPARISAMKTKGSFCKVLAVVEVKRNPDDLGHAFLGYQQALSWLSGRKDLYDAENWKTRAYPNGHFNGRPFLHVRNGEAILFSMESFADLRMRSISVNSHNVVISSDPIPNMVPGPQIPDFTAEIDQGTMSDMGVKDDISKTHSVFLEDLYFVTKDGSLESIHSRALCWVLGKISSETQFDDDLLDLDAIEDLRLRVGAKHPHLMSTYDLLSIYSENQVTEQIFVVSDKKKF